MTADISDLSLFALSRAPIPLLWAPVFLRPEVGSGYFHLYPPDGRPHPHKPIEKEQAQRLAAALEDRDETGAQRVSGHRALPISQRAAVAEQVAQPTRLAAAEPDRVWPMTSPSSVPAESCAGAGCDGWKPQRTGESGAPVGRGLALGSAARKAIPDDGLGEIIFSAGMGRPEAGAGGERRTEEGATLNGPPALVVLR